MSPANFSQFPLCCPFQAATAWQELAQNFTEKRKKILKTSLNTANFRVFVAKVKCWPAPHDSISKLVGKLLEFYWKFLPAVFPKLFSRDSSDSSDSQVWIITSGLGDFSFTNSSCLSDLEARPPHGFISWAFSHPFYSVDFDGRVRQLAETVGLTVECNSR